MTTLCRFADLTATAGFFSIDASGAALGAIEELPLFLTESDIVSPSLPKGDIEFRPAVRLSKNPLKIIPENP
jgi:hypothetical protein